jgi:hypothetical protein
MSMHNRNIPSDTELPSTEKLIKSTVMAALIAIVLLLVAVLPAEYGVDPTGVGEALGLRRMGEIKDSLAQEAAAARIKEVTTNSKPLASSSEAREAASAPEAVKSESTLSHEMKVDLAPNEGTEIKVVMEKGRKVRYKWWSDAGRANFDMHGDSKKLKISYHNYSKGSEQRSEGVIEAAFAGSHGWFWRNRTPTAMSITLQTSGEYTDIKHLK